MKIVVTIRNAAVLDDEFELADDMLAVDSDFVDWEMNEWDTFSLEAALMLKDADESTEVVAVTIAADDAEELLLGCLAKGADRAILIEREGARLDALANARVLATVVAREQPELVFCGAQSADTVNGATGSAIAGLTGLPCVAVVRNIELRDGEAVVERELEGGTIERLVVRLPALLTIQSGINEPRYATLRAIKQARDKPLEVVEPDGLDVADSGAPGAHLIQLHVPEQGDAKMLEGDAASVSEKIANVIRERMA
jgi:electron transfer flavoprotein beta subunit